MKMFSSFVLLLIIPTIWAEAKDTDNNKLQGYQIPRTEVLSIKNSQTKSKDKLYVKLPENYTNNRSAVYPVIYFTDPELHIEILSAATELLLKNIILVGVSWQKDMQYGKEAIYLDFFRKDVIPYVESHYRAGSNHRAYFGYSAGGLFGAYVLSEQPETFTNYILGSPAFDRSEAGKNKVFELASNPGKKKKALNANVFVSYGTLENESSVYIKEFAKMLESRGDMSTSLSVSVIEGDHQTAFPMTGVKSIIWLSDINK